jgi:heptosyltransferase-1
MRAPRILFVKLSSLGDVIHHLPALTDAARRWPAAHIAWALDPAYAELVRLHPAVRETIAVNLRSLRRGWFRAREWSAFRAARAELRAAPWDYIVDTQGLVKSACIARGARGVRFGFDSASAREGVAARFYDVKLAVGRRMHAVERNRRLVAGVFGHRVDSVADYGLEAPAAPPSWAPQGPYIVMLHSASRKQKTWPEAYWVTLGQRLAERGYAIVFPSGSESERATAHRLAMDVPGSMAAPASGLADMAALLAHAWAVVGLDTGLTHLAVALGRPTIGIYCATDPALTGLHGGAHAVNLGGPGTPPSVEAVATALGCGVAAGA